MRTSQKDNLTEFGFIEIEGLSSDAELIYNARHLGSVIPHSNGELIFILRPKDSNSAYEGTLSNIYGFGTFPYHTDTSFWPSPARYILLHSDLGSKCDTLIVAVKDIWESLSQADRSDARRAIFITKTIHRQFYASLIFEEHGIRFIRYDPSCMAPMNDSAKRIVRKLNKLLKKIPPLRVNWTEGKTLIIDNWKLLHGRDKVNDENHRTLKRIYIK